MDVTIGYEKQYEDFKNQNLNSNNYSFDNNGYKTQCYSVNKWKSHHYVPKDENERFIVTKESYSYSSTEAIVGTYDTFEEAYRVAVSCVENGWLYIHAHCANIIFSNKNIEHNSSIILVEKYIRIPLNGYSYSKFEFEKGLINKDNFNYQFFNKISPACKVLMRTCIEDEYIKSYMLQNILDSIKLENINETKKTCYELLSHDSIDPKLLFEHIYQKDVPLNKQYDLIDGCFSVNRYITNDPDTDSLIEDKKTRDIVEECYLNTRMHHYKARYIAKNYARLSKKYDINIYELLKYGIDYDSIEGLTSKVKNKTILFGISKCIRMNGSTSIDSIDFLLYAIDRAKKKDLNKATLELISTLMIEKLLDYCYLGNNMYMTNEANFQLIADKTIEELLKTKKNKVIFIKKIQNRNKDYNVTLFSKCLLNSIHTSKDIKIRKALVKIGVEGK